MRKQELLHLHRLLHAIRLTLETEGSVPDDAFAAYDDLRLGPNACNRNKRDHERAVRRLLAGIETAIDAWDADEPSGRLLVH